MTSARPFPPETADPEEPPFWRGLWDTTLSYLKWGYGALLLSFVAYGGYRVARSRELLAGALLICVGAAVVLISEWVRLFLRDRPERKMIMALERILIPEPHLKGIMPILPSALGRTAGLLAMEIRPSENISIIRANAGLSNTAINLALELWLESEGSEPFLNSLVKVILESEAGQPEKPLTNELVKILLRMASESKMKHS